jgi:asparagine synthase (glutamine-hydrolysing)
MCGIFGIFSHDPLIRDQQPFVAALVRLMERRGPDDEGEWTDGEHIAFGFRRLAIIDPGPDGHQPMLSPDGRYALIFNGELYNFRELRRQLEPLVSFRSRSDTEVVLHAIAHWGPDALARFNGMFALAWFDAEEKRLLLARDPVGIKPLYYLLHPRGMVFGSQYDQMLRHPWCDRSRLNTDVLGLYLRLGYLPPPYGIVAGTFQVEPGHYIEVTPGRPPRDRPFYDLPSPTGDLGRDEAGEATAAVVASAVTRQMVSDVPIGAFLSGGIDSPLVAAHMQRASHGRVKAFSIGSDDPMLDESAEARAYADAIGVDHVLRHFTGNDSLALIDKVADAYSEPFADHSAFPTMLVSAVARQHVTVALSGDGGDEAFWGYPRFPKVLGARQSFTRPRLVRSAHYVAGRFMPIERPPRGVLFPTIGDWYLDSHSMIHAPERDRLLREPLPLPDDFHLFDLSTVPAPDDLAQWLRRNEIYGHLQMILTKVDRASMYHSLEVRVPLLDVDVLACAMRIQPAACMVDGLGKVPLRQALGRMVDPALITTKKRGFSIPTARWLRDELRPYVEDLLLGRDPWPGGLFDGESLAAVYEQHRSGARDHTTALWNLLSLQLWADRHLNVPPATAA